MTAKRLFNVLVEKIAPEERDIYRQHAGEYIEHHGGDDSESVAVGGEARYAVALDDKGAEAFRSAGNLLELEEVAIDEAYGPIHNGVDRDMLAMHNMLDLEAGPLKPLLMVADTGDTGNAYVRSRLLERWTWFKDDGLDRNSHGGWCLGAATPPEPGRFVLSAKVLGDNGSGANSNGIAALYKFARLCRDRQVPGVASLSLGSKSPSNAYRDAVAFCIASNVAVVAAAGNDSRRDGISYPGVYAASVGAHDRAWNPAAFSNRSRDHTLPDVYALGVGVNGIGGAMSGTSMATPGVARALWYAMSRGAEAKEVEKLLRSHNGSSRVLDAGKLMPPLPKLPKEPEKPEEPDPGEGVPGEGVPGEGVPGEGVPGEDSDTRYVVQAGSFAGRRGAEKRLEEVRAGKPVKDAFIAIVTKEREQEGGAS